MPDTDEGEKIVQMRHLKEASKDLWQIDILDEKKRQSVLGIAVQEVYCEKSRNEKFRNNSYDESRYWILRNGFCLIFNH